MADRAINSTNLEKWLKDTKLSQEKRSKLNSLALLSDSLVPRVLDAVDGGAEAGGGGPDSAASVPRDVRRRQAVSCLPPLYDDLLLLARDRHAEVRQFVAELIGGLTARALSLQLAQITQEVEGAQRMSSAQAAAAADDSAAAAARATSNLALDTLVQLLSDSSHTVVSAAVRSANLLLHPLLALTCAELAVRPVASSKGPTDIDLAYLVTRSARLAALDRLISLVVGASQIDTVDAWASGPGINSMGTAPDGTETCLEASNDAVRLQALKFAESAILAFSSDATDLDDDEDNADAASFQRKEKVSENWPDTVQAAQKALAAAHKACDPADLKAAAVAASSIDLSLVAPGSMGLALRSALRRRSDGLVDRLLVLLRPKSSNLSAAAASVVVNSLSNISRKRPSRFLHKVVPALVAFSSSPPAGLAASQINSLKHGMKISLLALLKLRTPTVLPVSEALVECLTSELGLHPDQVWDAARWIRGERLRRDRAQAQQLRQQRQSQQQGQPPQDQRLGQPQMAYDPTTVLRTVPQLQAIDPNCLASLVMHFMNNLPLAPPVSPDSSFIEQQQQQEQLDQLQRPSESGGGDHPASGSQTPYPTAVVAELTGASAVSSSAGPSSLHSQRPRLLAMPLAPAQCEKIAATAFNRILDAEAGVKISGQESLRRSLLVQLVRDRSLDHPMAQALLDHICTQFQDRADVAQAWLFSEWTNETDLDHWSPDGSEDNLNAETRPADDNDGQAAVEVKQEQLADGGGQDDTTAAVGEDSQMSPLAPGGSQPNERRYEKLLLALIQRLRDTLEPGDQAIARLLVEVPEVTERALDLVSDLCNDPDRLAIGLSALRDLLLSRPVQRPSLIQRLLRLAVHTDEGVRLPAVRLIVNKLYSLEGMANPIEAFAVSALEASVEPPPEKAPEPDADSANQENQAGAVDQKGPGDAAGRQPRSEQTSEQDRNKSSQENQQPHASGDDARRNDRKDADVKQDPAGPGASSTDDNTTTDGAMDERQDGEVSGGTTHDKDGEKETEEQRAIRERQAAEERSARTIAWAHCQMSLFFALCTKKAELLSSLVPVFQRAGSEVRRVMHQQLAGLARTLGAESPALLAFVTDCQPGAESLVLQVLHTLTESERPSQQLAEVVQALHKRMPDPRFLIPILSALSKDQVEGALLKLVSLPANVVKNVLQRLSQQGPPIHSPLSPAELLLMLHKIEVGADRTLLKKLMDAIQLCFENRAVFTQEVTAVALQRLLNLRPLPPLFMRTVILSLGRFPRLTRFVLSNILRVLIQRKVWEDRLLYEGFIKACKLTLPLSTEVLAALPVTILSSLLDANPGFVAPLAKYVRDNRIRGKLGEVVMSRVSSRGSSGHNKSTGRGASSATTKQQKDDGSSAGGGSGRTNISRRGGGGGSRRSRR